MAKLIAPPVEDTLAKFELQHTPQLVETEVEKKISAAADAGQEPELSPEEAESLYAEAAAIDASIEKLTERREAIKAAFRRLPYGTKTVHQEAGGRVTIGRNPIFNEAKFLVDKPYDEVEFKDEIVEVKGRKRIQSVETYPNRKYYQLKVDRQAIKDIPDFDTKYFDEGEKKVTIR